MAKEFVDYYEVLEVSRNANMETVERVFRYMARKFHPDVSSDNETRFKQLVEAFEVLRDPTSRAEYDKEWEQDKTVSKELIDGANSASDDIAERERILSVFYAQRRRDMKNPGVSMGKIAELTNCPESVLEFHFWYLKSKGWVERLESGQFAITYEGVDRIEETYRSPGASATLRIEHLPDSPEAIELETPVAGQKEAAPSSPSAVEPGKSPEPKADPAEELRRKMMALHSANSG